MMLDIMDPATKSLDAASSACDELLDGIVDRADPILRKAADHFYEQVLDSVQGYLKDNATWNLSNEVDRCRRTETENRFLTEQMDALKFALLRISNKAHWSHAPVDSEAANTYAMIAAEMGEIATKALKALEGG